MGKQIHIHSQASARKALSFARAVRATLQAEEQSALMHINETEEYLGLLRARKALIELRLSEADDQVGTVREILDSDGIPEISLSDDEDSSSVVAPPTSPKDIGMNSSDVDSDTESYYSRRRDNSDDTSSLSGEDSYFLGGHLAVDQARVVSGWLAPTSASAAAVAESE